MHDAEEANTYIWKAIWQQLPLVIILALIVLDAVLVTTWVLRLTVNCTVKHAEQALLCMFAMIVNKTEWASDAVRRVAMFMTTDTFDGLQCHARFALSQSVLITLRLRLHFAILSCIIQRILALKADPF